MTTNVQDELLSLLQGYGSLCPIKNLTWPQNLSADTIQKFLLDELLLNPHFLTYPPDSKHQRSFWKWVIDKLEEGGDEVDERIYDQYINSLGDIKTNAHDAPRPSFRTYILKKNENLPKISRAICHTSNGSFQSYESITLLESGTTIENGTTGLRTWSASFALATFLETHAELLNARVLELGSGAGFLGILMAKLQMQRLNRSSVSLPDRRNSSSLLLSDIDPNVLERCRNNLTLPCNGLNGQSDVTCRLLDWSDALGAASKEKTRQFLKETDPDVIVGADLVYDIDIIPALVATIALALDQPTDPNRPARRAYIALTVRNEDTVARFRNAASAVLDLKEEILKDLPSLLVNESLEGKHGWPILLFCLTSRLKVSATNSLN